MKLHVIIHEADEGGYWVEVPALHGCFSQGETLDELNVNIREAIECYFDRPLPRVLPNRCRIIEIEF